MRAAVYVRVSREEQLDNWSIAAQTREAEEYCRQKNWELLKIYTEEGISAHSDSIIKRPNFASCWMTVKKVASILWLCTPLIDGAVIWVSPLKVSNN